MSFCLTKKKQNNPLEIESDWMSNAPVMLRGCQVRERTRSLPNMLTCPASWPGVATRWASATVPAIQRGPAVLPVSHFSRSFSHVAKISIINSTLLIGLFSLASFTTALSEMGGSQFQSLVRGEMVDAVGSQCMTKLTNYDSCNNPTTACAWFGPSACYLYSTWTGLDSVSCIAGPPNDYQTCSPTSYAACQYDYSCSWDSPSCWWCTYTTINKPSALNTTDCLGG